MRTRTKQPRGPAAEPPLRFLSPIHKAGRQIGRYLEPRCTELGLAPAEGHIISYLRTRPGTTVGELNRVFGLKPSTMTSTLGRLESAGLLVRSIAREDRRRIDVRLTPRGARAAKAIRIHILDLEEAIRRHIEHQDLAGFRSVIAAIETATSRSRETRPGEEKRS